MENETFNYMIIIFSHIALYELCKAGFEVKIF